jgi:hypothetical protein
MELSAVVSISSGGLNRSRARVTFLNVAERGSRPTNLGNFPEIMVRDDDDQGSIE